MRCGSVQLPQMNRTFLLPLIGILGLLGGCGPAEAPKVAPGPSAVTVALPTKKQVVEWDEYSGRLEARETVDIRARVAGYLDQIHFQEGKDVAAGDLLFTIDKRPYEAELEKAQADYDRSVSRQKLSTSEFERSKDLLSTRAVSQQDYDAKLQAQAEASAAMRSAEAAVNVAKLNLEFTEIRSPISGKIGRALVTKGNLVVGGSTATSATMLANVVSTDPIYCYIDVDEQASLRYRKLRQDGQRSSALDGRVPCEMALGDETGFPHKGEIDFVDNKLDPGTGTIRCRGVFKSEGRPLSPGYFARVRIPGRTAYEGLLIPDSAISTDLSQKFVFLAGADDVAEFRPVILGPLMDGLRVIREGLKAEDRVIVNGQARIRAGAKIKVQ